MRTKNIISLFFVLTSVVSISAQAGNSVGYWYSTSGDIVRSGFGECWRTIQWSSSNTLPECEGGMKKSEADSDKDGIVDSKDQCPNTATGITVNAKGCAKDGDNDGVSDAKDKCPDTQANTNVDANGCEIRKDSDGDGIVDGNDDCPDTASGTVVNNRGCILQANISLNNVQFKTGTAVLSTTSRNILDNVANTLKDNEHLNFEVAGHTDNTGNYQYNVDLSERRAESVLQYLVDQGVAADRLAARGYGPDKPVTSNDTREGRIQNRRVELVLQ